MKRLGAFVAIAIALAATALPARAAQFVQDGAGMFSAGTVAQLEQQIGAFNRQTGKEIVVVTVPSLNGETRQQAAQTVFSEQNINGVLIFIAKAERQDIIVPGRATAQFFPASTTTQIRQAMESQFKNGDFDGGITTAVNQTLDVFRAHLGSLPGNSSRNYPATTYQRPAAVSNGVHLSMFWWIVIIVVGFLVLRSIFRAMSGPRYVGGPGAPGGGMPGGYGYGGPGYYGGGGGGFWSGLLGGLGGAWLGNELFNRNAGGGGGGGIAPTDSGGNWGGNAPDAGGWGNDAGQADMGSSSGGDWGGGGFGGGDFGGGGGGFGGGDSGGGGGGDSGGGGGGDSGGGW